MKILEHLWTFFSGTPRTDLGSEPLMNQDMEKAKQLKRSGYNGERILMQPTDIAV